MAANPASEFLADATGTAGCREVEVARKEATAILTGCLSMAPSPEGKAALTISLNSCLCIKDDFIQA